MQASGNYQMSTLLLKKKITKAINARKIVGYIIAKSVSRCLGEKSLETKEEKTLSKFGPSSGNIERR